MVMRKLIPHKVDHDIMGLKRNSGIIAQAQHYGNIKMA